jgi:hypothetical protein
MSINMKISSIKEVVPARDGNAIVVKADVVVGAEATEMEIAITTDLAASVAIALLASTAQARAERDGLQPALEVLAAAVVASGSAEKVRLQLLFDQGKILPIELKTEAAEDVTRDLVKELSVCARDNASDQA